MTKLWFCSFFCKYCEIFDHFADISKMIFSLSLPRQSDKQAADINIIFNCFFMARSEELVKNIYLAAQEVYDNIISLKDQKIKMQNFFGMNPGSFNDFYYGYAKMRTGEISKRGLETRSYDYFILKIYEEFGRVGLEKALQSFRQTLDYYQQTIGVPCRSWQRIYDKYSELLKSRSGE